MAGGGSSGGQTQTVTQQQQIPAFEQQFAQNNQNLAASLGSQPYPMYQGPLVQGFSPLQTQGQGQAVNAANSYAPLLNQAATATQQGGMVNPLIGSAANSAMAAGSYGAPELTQAMGMYGNSANANGMVGQGAYDIQNALGQSPANGNTIAQYMSPYVQQALAPQITALQAQMGQQQNQIGAQATGANAFGDARQGVESSLQNFYGNQALGGLEAQGYNTAYSNALNTATQEQGLGLNAGSSLMGAGAQQQQLQQGAAQGLSNLGQSQQQLGLNIGSLLNQIGTGQQGLELQSGNQLGQLAGQTQQLGLNGANAIYNAGNQQQQLGQQELNTAYQQFMNQAQWPYQGLNVMESALSNSPYNITNQTTLPNANSTAQNLGMFASLAGLMGGGGSSLAPFGGQPYNAGTAQVA